MKYTDSHLGFQSVSAVTSKQSVHRLLQSSVKVFMNNPVTKYEFCKIRQLQNNKMFVFFNTCLLHISFSLS